ncbi:MAG: hypothetical protein KDK91_28010, partial [Gammaproteobacteria bacterium]|nr:hypothetical protein [Gammaproteobacteria bacterium]
MALRGGLGGNALLVAALVVGCGIGLVLSGVIGQGNGERAQAEAQGDTHTASGTQAGSASLQSRSDATANAGERATAGHAQTVAAASTAVSGSPNGSGSAGIAEVSLDETHRLMSGRFVDANLVMVVEALKAIDIETSVDATWM